MKKSAYLVGPFIGELEWELFRFAPYIIHLKKMKPSNKVIVYTRTSRFDLYGNYADILVPLNLKSNRPLVEEGFGLRNFENYKYNILKDFYYKKYSKRYVIEEHIFPYMGSWERRIKWQLPRDNMDYDFRPRKENYNLLDGFFDSTSNVFVCNNDSDIRHFLFSRRYNPIMYHWVVDIVKHSKKGLKLSFVGCLIVLLRNCKFIVANMNSTAAKLALLLKIPVISINEKMTYDSIKLLNPFNTPVINCYNIEEGVDIYENNI